MTNSFPRMWLKSLRKQCGLSQVRVAESLHICRSHYSRIELGQKNLRGMRYYQCNEMSDQFVQLSELFNVPVETIRDYETKYMDKRK
jgi:transcriptional regulator with XRE-family HTH domain